jgi:hypothetical protein
VTKNELRQKLEPALHEAFPDAFAKKG